MKIGLVMTIDYLNQAKCGGVVSFVRTLAKFLENAGNDIHIITFSSQNRITCKGRTFVHEIKHPTLHYYFSRIWKYSRGFARVFKDLECSWVIKNNLIKIIREHDLDIIEYADTWAESFFHPKEMVPSVVRLHGPYFLWQRLYGFKESPGYKIHNKITRKVITDASGLVAPSQFLKGHIESEFNRTVELIPNLLDFDLFFPDRGYCKRSNSTRIIMVGRIGDEQKGADILFKAIGLSIKINKNLLFTFAGSDDLPDKVKRQFGSYVNYLGCLSPENLAEEYRKSDIAVIPSITWENFPYACAEPMACGLPAIGSRVGGIPELIDDNKTGLLFNEGDATELSTKILQLAENKLQREDMGKNALTKILSISSPEVITNKTLAAYEKLIH